MKAFFQFYPDILTYSTWGEHYSDVTQASCEVITTVSLGKIHHLIDMKP